MHVTTNKNIGYIIIGGTIGNLTEWYNFLLYGYLAPVISQLFFPTKNKLLALTLVFTVFALSFLARPLGGILFGWVGDTYGRKRALVVALITMTIPTVLIGVLPTYASIGILSPILLCILRIFQGLSAGGEHTGSGVYMAEYAASASRSFWVSTVPTSAALGVLVSSVVALIIANSFAPDQLLAWGWRVGYWIGALLCFISIYFRVHMPETEYFLDQSTAKIKKRHPIRTLIQDSHTYKSLLIVFGLAASWGVFYQIFFIWMPTYLTQVINFSNNIALQLNSIYLLLFAGLVLWVGYWADHIQRKFIFRVACIAMLVLAYPLFAMIASGHLWQAYFAMGIFTVVFSLYIPTAFVTMVESFNTEIRYTGLSFGFNMGLAIFGGTCPLIATWLINITQNKLAPAFYVMLAAVIALYAASHAVDKRGQVI